MFKIDMIGFRDVFHFFFSLVISTFRLCVKKQLWKALEEVPNCGRVPSSTLGKLESPPRGHVHIYRFTVLGAMEQKNPI